MKLSISSCEWHDIKDMVASNIKDNQIVIDSFLEDHILKSNHYKIHSDKETVGYFSIFDSVKLLAFYMKPYYSNMAQQIFSEIKKYEQVMSAMVPTSDEFFFSHCLDNYKSLTKQAYFSIYTDKAFDDPFYHLEACPVITEEDLLSLDFTGDFLSDEDKNKIRDKIDYYKVFVMKDQGKSIGCGIVEYGRVDKSIASIGMFVAPDYRQKGYGKSILKTLQMKVEKEGFIARSGCWYYNHNSKKSMEAAGAYTKTRLINFQF